MFIKVILIYSRKNGCEDKIVKLIAPHKLKVTVISDPVGIKSGARWQIRLTNKISPTEKQEEKR